MSNYKPLKKDEKTYVFETGTQISMQTGLIGHFRADFGNSGREFYSSWTDFRKDLKTEDFIEEFENLIDSLREKNQPLSNRAALFHFCDKHPEWAANDGIRKFYLFRSDSDKYTYLFRLNPMRGDYNIYIYCYIKQYLDEHLRKARKGIRFIDSSYNELFRVKDGGKVRITYWNGNVTEKTCHFIDDYHFQLEQSIFHICQFAEFMERNENKVEAI